MKSASSSDSLPLVSAIIATYNRAHIVGEAIESILAQTYRNIEIIVVDDGSKDNTQEMLKQYGDRIRVVCQENSGPAAAWNRGIRESRGEIITFLGSDDIWLPTFIARQVAVLNSVGDEIPCSLSNTWLRFADGKGSTAFQYALLFPAQAEGIWLNVAEVLATRFVVFGQCVAIRRSALKKTGLFDESFWLLEDYDLALKLSMLGPWGFVREPLVIWRQGTTDSLSRKALGEGVKRNQILVKIRERMLDMLQGGEGREQLRSLHMRELRRSRRELWSAKMSTRGRWGQVTDNVVRFSGRCSNFLYRRSSRYPKMVTLQLQQTLLHSKAELTALRTS